MIFAGGECRRLFCGKKMPTILPFSVPNDNYFTKMPTILQTIFLYSWRPEHEVTVQ